MDLSRTILIYDSIAYFKPLIEQYGVRCYPSFKKVSFLQKIFRRISFRTHLLESIWYDKWKDLLPESDTVIIFATTRFDYIQFIADRYQHIRIIVWYWNPVFRCFKPSKLTANNIEFWSFDTEDYKNYNLQHNSTFYFKEIIPLVDKGLKDQFKYDVVFLGNDKGRGQKLTELKNVLEKFGLRTFFHVVSQNNNLRKISYDNYLEILSESRMVLDYIQEGQTGMTLRVMESLFLRKKLITNDTNIVNYSFYSQHNMFVLGLDDFTNFRDFVESPYDESISKHIDYYDFGSWIERFNLR